MNKWPHPWKPWKKYGPSKYRQFIKKRKHKLDRLAFRMDPEGPDTSKHYSGWDD